MTFPTDVVFRAMDASEALRAHAVARAQRLSRFADDIESCHVTIAHAGAHRHGNAYTIHARLSVRGKQLDAHGGPNGKAQHEDPYALVADTFDALQRCLEDHVRKRRGDVKAHAGDA